MADLEVTFDLEPTEIEAEFLLMVDPQYVYTFSDGLTETDHNVTLDKATATAIGGVKIGSNISVDSNAVISVGEASTIAKGVMRFATDSEATAGVLGDVAINPAQLKTVKTSVADTIAAETNRAENAESALQQNITNEVTRATAAETQLSNTIKAETDRAELVETVLQNNLNSEIARAQSVEATKANVSLNNLDAAGEARFSGKQDKLTASDGVTITNNNITNDLVTDTDEVFMALPSTSAELANRTYSASPDTYINMVPDWSKAVALTSAQLASYTTSSNGYLVVLPQAVGTVSINSISLQLSASLVNLPLAKGDTVATTLAMTTAYFLPAKSL